MPRKPRKLSSSGIYHIVVRGLDRQIMFDCAKDFIKYKELLATYLDECSYKLYAYCLMSNHVHLILKVSEVPLEIFFKKLNTHYAVWFNMKYQRVGHLQQERFYSEPVESDSYLLTAIRYVHQNPFHAGLEQEPGLSYPWSSIFEYQNMASQITDIDLIYDMISPAEFLVAQKNPSTESCLDIDNVKTRIPDDVAKEMIIEVSGIDSVMEFEGIPLKMQKSYLRQLFAKGISIRQLNRLTGIPKGVIERTVTKGRSS